MKMMVEDGYDEKGERILRPLQQMSFQQTKQAAAIMDCIGRLIPHEGVDYDVEVIFRGAYDPNVSMNISAHNEKGEWWKRYVMDMMKKHPPTVNNPEPSLPIDND